MNLRDHFPLVADDAGICSHCGQALPAGHRHAHTLGYGEQRVNRTGAAVAVLLHVLLLALFLLSPPEKKAPVVPPGGSIAYITPPKPKAERREPAKAAPKKTTPRLVKKSAAPRIDMPRLPNTISVPAEPPTPPAAPVEPDPPKVAKVDPAEDMAAMIEARRRSRGQSDQPSEETEAERGNRIARANIAGANARGPGDGKDRGAFEVVNQTFNTAQVKLDTKFLGSTRPSLKQERVDLGAERDIETAVIKKLIEMLIREKYVDMQFTTRSGRKIAITTRPEYRAELEGVLMRDIYPNYQPPRQ